jgi:hypothetical protein
MSREFDDSFIEEVDEQLKILAVQRQTAIAKHAHNRLSIRTPWDTGQARAGWNFTLNTQDFSKPQEVPKAKKGQSQQILPPKPSVPDKEALTIQDKYFLVNAVEHIVYLNEGHSDKAPTNFVEQEILLAKQDVENGSV